MRDTDAITVVQEELVRAITEFGDFNSPHEGYAVIQEELDELWELVKTNAPKGEQRKEARQVAAMAIRYMVDLT